MRFWNLKPALAMAASLGMLTLVGEAAAEEPLSWSKGTVPANAVIAGGTKDNPMHICRLPLADKNLHPGKVVKGNCYVGFGGKEIKKPLAEAEVLASSAPTGWANVKGGKVPASALKAGTANNVTMHFCRANHQGKGLQAGKEYKGNCYFGYGGKEIKTAEFQVMGLMKVAAAPAAPPSAAPGAAAKPTGPTANAPATPNAPASAPTTAAKPTAPVANAPAAQPSPVAAAAPAAADPLTWSKGAVPANAVIAGGSKEKPMNICRLPMADKSLHPGKVVNGNCYVGFGGKEIKVPLKDAEVLASSAPTGWANVKGGKVPASALKAGVVNGVTMHFCRANHEGKGVQAGKEYKGNCYYGYGGKEIKAAEFQVMGVQKLAAKPAAPAKK